MTDLETKRFGRYNVVKNYPQNQHFNFLREKSKHRPLCGYHYQNYSALRCCKTRCKPQVRLMHNFSSFK